MKSWIKVRSYGGADTVTGSAHVITATIDGYDYQYMVDCGLFQGSVSREHYEWGFNLREIATDINGVFITHAHIDHFGRVPALHRWGYNGPIYATAPVCELAECMLIDSAKIQLEEYCHLMQKELAKRERGEEFSEIELLYELKDVNEVLGQFVPIEREKEIVINKHLTVYLYNAGHGLGSSSIKLTFNNGEETFTMLFSGDLGNENNPILQKPSTQYICGVDAVFMETTYAGRFHASQEENWAEVREKMAQTIVNGGKVILPVFAVGRAQEMLYLIYKDMMENSDWVANVFLGTPIYVDSLLAVSATKIFKRFPAELNEDVQKHMKTKKNNPFDFPNLTLLATKEESIQLSEKKEPCIILSAAGMCDAGRVIYHLKDNLEDPFSLVVFPGYQAEGSMGRRLLDGEKYVTIAKKPLTVRASLVELNAFSGHADQNGLISWLNQIEPGYMLFLTHGEEEPQGELKGILDNFANIATTNCLKRNVEYLLSSEGIDIHPVPTEEVQPKKQGRCRGISRKPDKNHLARLYDELEMLRDVDGCEKICGRIKKQIGQLKSDIYQPNSLELRHIRIRRA